MAGPASPFKPVRTISVRSRFPPAAGEGAALAPGGLFHVAKLCFPKGGGVEVHYYDRLRALELLAGLPGGRDEAGELLEALGRSAGALGEVEDG